MRARIVLGCGEWLSNSSVAKRLHITDARPDRRPGRRSGTKTLESMPDNSTHWSSHRMAQKVGLSQAAIGRIWHAFGLQPHRVENFKFSKHPQFVETVREMVINESAEHAMVLCVDQKSPVHALNRTQPVLTLEPGVPARQSHDYERHGVTSLCAAF